MSVRHAPECPLSVPAQPGPVFARPLARAQAAAAGRVLVYDPASGETRCLADGLHFSNGIALAEDESYLVVGETDKLALVKLWLKGPKAGSPQLPPPHPPT